jgi:hypothetical protein
MLKQLLATSALVIVGAVFIQSANAADDSKLRQLIVEPAGSHAPDAAGLPATNAGKVEPSLVKTDGGIATPAPVQTADSGAAAAIAANGAALASKPVNELVVSPSGGVPTPPAGAPAIPAGTPTADAGVPAAGAAGAGAPVTADPGAPPATLGIPAASGAAPADAGQPASSDAAPAAPAIAAPAAPAAPAVAVPAAPAANPAPALAVNNPDDLYKVLTGRGYGVTISQPDAHGDVIFYVTIPNQKDAYLLTVSPYGKVNYTQHIAAYAYGHSYTYDQPTYAPRYSYSPAYGSDDNCDYGTGSNAGY